MVRNFLGEDRWIPGMILRTSGPVTSSVDIGKVQAVKRYVDLLRQKSDLSPKSIPEYTDDHYFQ